MPQPGLSVTIKDAVTVVLSSRPLMDPPEVPSHVNVPESVVPVCVILMVIGQPSMWMPPLFVHVLSLTHVPETSATVGLLGVALVGVLPQPETMVIAKLTTPHISRSFTVCCPSSKTARDKL